MKYFNFGLKWALFASCNHAGTNPCTWWVEEKKSEGVTSSQLWISTTVSLDCFAFVDWRVVARHYCEIFAIRLNIIALSHRPRWWRSSRNRVEQISLQTFFYENQFGPLTSNTISDVVASTNLRFEWNLVLRGIFSSLIMNPSQFLISHYRWLFLNIRKK